jgi:hypothetical protein
MDKVFFLTLRLECVPQRYGRTNGRRIVTTRVIVPCTLEMLTQAFGVWNKFQTPFAYLLER